MNDLKNEQDLEKMLLDHLSDHKVEKKTLNAISQQIVNAYKHGMKITDWHIKGQPPRIDQIIVSGTVPASNLAALGKLTLEPNWRELIIFRKGIPKPDYFDVQIKIQPERVSGI